MLAHSAVYAILSVPHALWLGRHLGWGLLGLLAFSGMIELIQPAFGRGAEWTDMLSNVVGMALGVFAGLSLRQLHSVICGPSKAR